MYPTNGDRPGQERFDPSINVGATAARIHGNGSLTASAPPTPRLTVSTMLEENNRILHELHGELNDLTVNLQPVLSPSNAIEGKEAGGPPRDPMTVIEALSRSTSLVTAAVHRVRDLRIRLEL